MPSNAECLRQKTGSCGGCEVLGIIQRPPSTEIDQGRLREIADTYCPEGEKPVLPEMPKQSIW